MVITFAECGVCSGKSDAVARRLSYLTGLSGVFERDVWRGVDCVIALLDEPSELRRVGLRVDRAVDGDCHNCSQERNDNIFSFPVHIHSLFLKMARHTPARLYLMVKLKVEPSFSLLLTCIVPCIHLTSSLEMESPSPLPPYCLLDPSSPCLNYSNMVCNLSSGIPMPVSRT